MLSSFGCLAHLSYFTNWKEKQQYPLERQYLKRVRAYKVSIQDDYKDTDIADKLATQDQVQPSEQLLCQESMYQRETSCNDDFILYTDYNLSFCCFDPEETLERGKGSLQRTTLSTCCNCWSRVVLLPFRSIFVSYKGPSLDSSPPNIRKAQLLSSSSMQTICSPLLYSCEYVPVNSGSILYLQQWKTVDNNRRMVLVVHDVGSYGSFACLRLIPTFLNNGYDLATFDLRGHGRSIEKELDESNNLKYSSWNEEVWSSDLHQVILYILRSAENQDQVVNSLYLYGEGLGASIVLDYVIRYSQRQQLPWQLKGVIACGVMLKEISCKYSNTECSSRELWKPLSKRPSLFENFLLLQKFLWLLGQIVPNMVCNMRVDPTHWGLVPIDLSLFTRDLRVVQVLKGDTNRLRDMKFKHVLTLWELIHQLERLLKRKSLCTLCPHISFGLFHGGDDVLSPLSNLLFFENSRRMPCSQFHQVKNVEIFGYQQARHYLAHETLPVRRQFLDDMLSWLDRQESVNQ